MLPLTQKQYLYKLCVDGNDLLKTKSIDFSDYEIKYAKSHCIIPNFPNIDLFYSYCLELRQKHNKTFFGLSEELCQKYEIGYFKTTLDVNFDDNYILFSRDNLLKWNSLIPVLNLEFMVVFSRGIDNKINGIGLRILDQSTVDNAFKWVFPLGQDCTFGLNTVPDNTKDLIIVEGFTDMIAAKESGYMNSVGLGSVDISRKQKKLLHGYNLHFCYDQDNFGYLKRKRQKHNMIFFTPMGYKDPYECFLHNKKVDFIHTDNKF